MAKKREKPSTTERALEYIDSPRMVRRLRYGELLSAEILGNYGTYRTQLRIGKTQQAECTCPSEVWPCKHVIALNATWECHPETFFDVQPWLDALAKQSKGELLKMIGTMVMAVPETLGACGFEEFMPQDVESESD